MEIIRAGMQEADRAAALAQLLWPGHAQAELEQELAGYLQGPEGAVFLAREDGADVGFAQCGLRRDMWRERTPPGGVSGRRVCAKRNTGAGALRRRLLAACEAWAGEKGCAEFASDCGLDNAASAVFHLRAGFAEAGRIICFTQAAVRNVESEPLRDA